MEKDKIRKIIDLINWGDHYFSEKGVPESRLNIELMLCHILQCKRMQLYLNFDKPLIQAELDTLRLFVKRRISREPLQYILGETEFMGLTFTVNNSVLIPRQETEILVEEVIGISKLLKHDTVKILEIGSGSGNIAISLAKFINNAQITAIDKDEAALKTSVLNAENNGVTEKIRFLQLDIFNNALPVGEKFDIIVSNPPYIALKEYDALQNELFFEPKHALTDFADGFSFYKRIAELGKLYLSLPGYQAVEAAYNQSGNVKLIFSDNGYTDIKLIKDYSNHDRVITGVFK